MKIAFFTDPHLALQRKANSTVRSSTAREAAALSTLHGFLDRVAAYRICLGDLFDRHSNDEATIRQGLEVLHRVDTVMAGNHDVANREGVVGSLQLMKGLFPEQVCLNEVGESDAHFMDLENMRVTMVPHAISQELFEACLEDAETTADGAGGWKVLCLHCNVMSNFELDSASLNLTKERLEQLLGKFHFILIGHEHTARDLYDGRVKIVGSTYPTAFDNLDRKRALVFDTELGSFEDVELWSPEGNVWKGSASEIDEDQHYQFLDITDDLPAGDAPKLVVRLFDAGALGIRITHAETTEAQQAAPAVSFEYLPEVIDTDIRANRTDLIPPWEAVQDAN